MRVLTVVKTSVGATWLVPLMGGLQRRGHEVTVLLPDTTMPLGQELSKAGVAVAAAPAPLPGGSIGAQLKGVARLRTTIVQLRPDVIHYQLYSSALVGRLSSVGLPAARVHMVPGPLYLENRAIALLERFLVKLDDHVICSSSYLYEAYRRLGVARTNLSCIPYGVDLDRFRPPDARRRAAARSEVGASDEHLVVLCASYFYAPKRLVHRGRGIKGHDVLLQAWARFLSGGGAGLLLLVGGGFGEGGDGYRAAMRAGARDLGIENSIEWIGSTPDVRAYYEAADVSVAPSRSENLGSAAEASAMGVPSIASDVGGLPELVVDGATGWTHPVGDAEALGAALADAERLRRDRRLDQMGARARRLAEAMLDQGRCVEDFSRTLEAVSSERSSVAGRAPWLSRS